MDNNILGTRVRKARGSMSLREFAHICDISHTHLDSIEKGIDPRTGKRVSIKLETVKKISMATGLSVPYLTGDSDEKSGSASPLNHAPGTAGPGKYPEPAGKDLFVSSPRAAYDTSGKYAELMELMTAGNGVYMRLAKGAKEIGIGEEDVDFFLEFLKRGKKG